MDVAMETEDMEDIQQGGKDTPTPALGASTFWRPQRGDLGTVSFTVLINNQRKGVRPWTA